MRTFEWDIRLPHLHHRLPRLIHRAVPPTTQMQTERPERYPRGRAHHRRVLLDDLDRGRAGEEVEVKHAAEQAVLHEGLVAGGRAQEEDVSAGGGVEIDAVG